MSDTGTPGAGPAAGAAPGAAPGRREKAAALRQAEAARQRRSRVRVLAGSAALVVVLLAVVLLAGRGARSSSGAGAPARATAAPSSSSSSLSEVPPAPVAAGGPATVQRPAVVVPDRSGIPGVVAYAGDVSGQPVVAGALQHDHVVGPVRYSVTPPVGGPHNGQWLNCGVYTTPVPNERAVHDLEHGAVWITYRPSLPAGEVAALRQLVLRQSTLPDATGASWRYADLTPWADDTLPAPIVASAWGRQLRVTSTGDPRLQQFLDAFRARSGVTPEYGSPCGGEPVEIGGRPSAS